MAADRLPCHLAEGEALKPALRNPLFLQSDVTPFFEHSVQVYFLFVPSDGNIYDISNPSVRHIPSGSRDASRFGPSPEVPLSKARENGGQARRPRS